MHGASPMTKPIRRTGIPATIKGKPNPEYPVKVTGKRGRPRKSNVMRDGKGKSRGEIVDFSVVMNQPHRRGAKGDARKSELLGYPLGRLRFTGEVSEIQLRAGNEWALLVRAYAGAIGIPFGSPRSGSLLSDSGKPAYAFAADGPKVDPEEHERRISGLRGRYDACFERLNLVGRSLGRGHAILVASRRVCIEEYHPNERELGDLRIGLNALAHELGIR